MTDCGGISKIADHLLHVRAGLFSGFNRPQQWIDDACTNCGIEHRGEPCHLDEHGNVIEDDDD